MKIKYIIASIFLSAFLMGMGLKPETNLVDKNKPTAVDPAPQKSGVELWGNNCVRCHQVPGAPDFSDQEWESIIMHMRAIAKFTKKDAEAIKEFLQASN